MSRFDGQCERAVAGQLADQGSVPSTPQEVQAVLDGVRARLRLGYKRLAYALMTENRAPLRPWMVYDLLVRHHLLNRRQPPEALIRPPEADHPDQRWHTLAGRRRRLGEPESVHTGRLQFIGHDWRQFVQAVDLADARTQPYHPQSNGRDERVHRTFHEELPLRDRAAVCATRSPRIAPTTLQTVSTTSTKHNSISYQTALALTCDIVVCEIRLTWWLPAN